MLAHSIYQLHVVECAYISCGGKKEKDPQVVGRNPVSKH